MKSRFFIFILLCLNGLPFLSAQEIDSIRHLHIPEVTLTQSRELFFREDKKILKADSTQIHQQLNANLGELLSTLAPIYVNFYGSSGATASIFLRGSGSNQTTVNWNGFPLNSLTLGSADLSMIPVNNLSHISLVYGASASLFGSGSFGGSINIVQQPDWKSKMQISLVPEYGSYADRRISLSGQGGNSRLQVQSYFLRQQSLNNFPYRDIYKFAEPMEVTKNNSLENTVFIQNFFARLPGGNMIEGGIWFQSRMKEIPAIMGSYSPGIATQQDSTVKMHIKWSKLGHGSLFSLRTAWFHDYMLFSEKQSPDDRHYSLYSEIRSRKWMSDVNYRRYFGNYLSIDAGTGISYLSAQVLVYGREVEETIPVIYSGVKYRNEEVVLNLSLRKEFHEKSGVPVMISAGIRKEMFHGLMAFRMNYADQFRMPGFNDKYWQPGGNPDLLPEKGWTADAGIEYMYSDSRENVLSGDLSLFITNIENLIQWVPSGNSPFWSPTNTRQVLSRGMELQSSYQLNVRGFQIRNQATYSFSVNTIGKEYVFSSPNTGNQLIYRPMHLLRLMSGIQREKLHFSAHMIFTGLRFTTEDNNPVYAMPSHTIFHLYSGYQFTAGDMAATLQLRVLNLFNTPYQFVRSYPMPGRTYHLTLLIHYNKK